MYLHYRLNVPSIRREILAELRNTSISSQYSAQSHANISSTVMCDFPQFDEVIFDHFTKTVYSFSKH